ncbi:cytochrome p450 [Rhizoctonia solani]|uniref:Cytochrome p450 n=1 Tax=Rhizoctonia solani TaxID=456999 RepID=A0A8H7I5I6_9AGAM|nr:cytochrome p450 [Rhizoctonia solani]
MDSINQPHQYVALGTKYKDSLGDAISIKTPIETFIVVNTIESATELLEKQALLTANRPKNLMIRDLLGWSEGVAFRKHDEWHKRQRRLMTSALHFRAARAYEFQYLGSTLELLRHIHWDQTSFQKHVGEIINNFMLRLTYGWTSSQGHSSTTIGQTSPYTLKGLAHYFLVNDFPFLKYFPDWFPGGSFQTFGKEGKESRTMYASGLFETVFEQVRAGKTEVVSFVSALLETNKGIGGTEIESIKWTAASLFGGGTTTTVGLVLSFILMASLHPEAAKLAQAEIDAVIGRERLPRLKDRDNMPYTNALLQEVLRLCPPAPLGLPHITATEVQLWGYHIPKNATISPNIWAMLRDPKHFSSPHTFDPSRYLKPIPDPDPRKYVFGFGRRVCPGQHLANNATWIICTSILSVFELQAGPELLAKVASLGGLSSPRMYRLFQPYFVYDPLPFPCSFTARDQAAVDLLANST